MIRFHSRVAAATAAFVGTMGLAQAPQPACTAPEHSQFDFWVGEWSLIDQSNNRPAGTNRIEKLYGGCVIRENYSIEGFAGGSFNTYWRGDGKWHQTWMDSAGAFRHFIGGLNSSGRMVLTAEQPHPRESEKTRLIRLTFTPNADGTVRQYSDFPGSSATTISIVGRADRSLTSERKSWKSQRVAVFLPGAGRFSMGYSRPIRAADECGENYDLGRYWREGFAIVRGFFSAQEIADIAAAIDQVQAEGVAHGRSFRHGNLFYNVAVADDGAPMVRMAQWPSYHQPVLNGVRLDLRIARLLEPLIGRNLKQIINQVHWKAPGSLGDFAWHQDSRSRRPGWAFRNLATSYVQTGLAIDPHTPDSGGMRFIPRSHLRGDLGMDCSKKALGSAMTDTALDAVGLSESEAVDLILEPGDLALWSPYLVHGSGTNRSAHKRRFYINGYVRAEDCDRGEWAFRDGAPVPFGPRPALVHYEELHERPGPHYVGD